MSSAADPNPGSPEDNDSQAEPMMVFANANEPTPVLPEPEIEVEQETEEPEASAVPPPIDPDGLLSQVTPPPETPPTDFPRESTRPDVPSVESSPGETPNSVEPPPGDDTPTSSVPSPGRMGNGQPSDPGFDSNPPILYPGQAIRDGVEGTVVLRIRIGADGRVLDVTLVKSSGSVVLDRAATKGVRTWRGRPAQIAGRAIEAAALLPIVFRLH